MPSSRTARVLQRHTCSRDSTLGVTNHHRVSKEEGVEEGSPRMPYNAPR
jgi:hypothetical protein